MKKEKKKFLKVSDFDKDPEFHEGLTLLKAQEAIAKLMKDRGIKSVTLANKLGRDKSYVTQILSNGRNLTLKTFSRVLFCLDSEVSFNVRPIKKDIKAEDGFSKNSENFIKKDCSKSSRSIKTNL